MLYIVYDTYIISFNLHISHQSRRYLSPFYRQRHLGLEKINDLSKHRSILSGKAEIKNVCLSYSKPSALPICPTGLIGLFKIAISYQ